MFKDGLPSCGHIKDPNARVNNPIMKKQSSNSISKSETEDATLIGLYSKLPH